jgi:hypothetical protein
MASSLSHAVVNELFHRKPRAFASRRQHARRRLPIKRAEPLNHRRATHHSLTLVVTGCLTVLLGSVLACAAEPESPPIRATGSESLPNAYWLHKRVISGGLPAGANGFRELKELGVRTVISVDGLRPDVETAKKFGLRYVHLPHGYDGVPDERARELAKAIRSLPGPVYIHCHHGKHRSPAAAAVACIGAGLIPHEAGPAILKAAGTSADYSGLFASVDSARRLDAARLDDLQIEFREIVEPPPIVEVMTQLSTTLEHLQLIEAAGWKTPKDHPALTPAHEALLLKEHFTEFRRDPLVKAQPAMYRHLIDSSVREAGKLETLLKAIAPDRTTTDFTGQASLALKSIQSDCKACHRGFRDQRQPATRPGNGR